MSLLPMERASGNYVRLHAVSLNGEPRGTSCGIFCAGGTGGGRRLIRMAAFPPRPAPHPWGRVLHRVRNGDRVIMSKTVPLGPEPAAQPFRFQWNAAGSTLYLEAAVKETRSLWRVRVDPSTLDWLSADRLTPPAGRDVAASVSRDGTRIAFSQQHETSRIWRLPLQVQVVRASVERPDR